MKSDKPDNPTSRVVYKLKLEQLRPGDIILTRSPGQPVSELIQQLTSSEYSHAILVLDRPYAVESSKYGVVKFQLDRFAAHNSSNILVLRVRDKFSGNFDAAVAVKYAEDQITKPYAHLEVLVSLFRSMPRIENGTFFCSQLVADAYGAAGFALADGLQSERVTPALLTVSPLLTSVEDCMYECSLESLPFDHAFFDSSSPVSFAEQENLIKQRIVRDIQSSFARIDISVTSFNDVILKLGNVWQHDPFMALALDRELAQTIAESSLVGLASKLIPPDSDLYFIDFYLRYLLVMGEVSEERKRAFMSHYEIMHQRIKASNTERNRDVSAFRRAYLYSGLESIRLVLAATSEAFHISLRLAQVNFRCLTIIQEALAAHPSAT